MKRYSHKRVLITAGGKSIGQATAFRLLNEGAKVLITDIDPEALEQTKALAIKKGFSSDLLLTECFDLQDANDCNSGFTRSIEQLGGVDVLVSNAGGSLQTPYAFLDETDDDWHKVIELNIMATVRLLRQVIPLMVKNEYGRIVLLGSKAGRYGSLIAGANYSMVKGGISALTRQIAMEFGPKNITCNAVCPGIVMTDRVQALWAERRTERERLKVLDDVPLRRHAVVEDIASAIAFYGSDDASFVTGTVLDVNGGQAMCG